jgi:hypothetical protein
MDKKVIDPLVIVFNQEYYPNCCPFNNDGYRCILPEIGSCSLTKMPDNCPWKQHKEITVCFDADKFENLEEDEL